MLWRRRQRHAQEGAGESGILREEQWGSEMRPKRSAHSEVDLDLLRPTGASTDLFRKIIQNCFKIAATIQSRELHSTETGQIKRVQC